jgi:hypothetical protein
MAMDESPVAKLLRQLKPLIDTHEFSVIASKRYPEYPDVVRKAQVSVSLQEMAIEDLIRTWVESQPVQIRKLRNDDDDQPDA